MAIAVAAVAAGWRLAHSEVGERSRVFLTLGTRERRANERAMDRALDSRDLVRTFRIVRSVFDAALRLVDVVSLVVVAVHRRVDFLYFGVDEDWFRGGDHI